MKQQNNLRVFKTPDELNTAAADFIVALASDAISSRGRFAICLSGGHTPEHLYALLATPAYRERIEWKETYVFWGDERCVPFTNKDNNARMAIEALLSKVAIPAQNINRMQVNREPAEAAIYYERTLYDFFGGKAPVFDLILLGLGDNGHTASLFPGYDVVQEKTRWVRELYVKEQSSFRITLTLPIINQARDILFLVEGEGKATMLRHVLFPDNDVIYPAQMVCPVDGNMYWYADATASASL